MNPKNQTAADKNGWTDEKGTLVPYSRVTGIERKRERYAWSLFKESLAAQKQLEALREAFEKKCNELLAQVLEENNVKSKGKGNHRWYNFDQSIRVECSINEAIKFDDAMIIACKAKLDEFLSNTLTGNEEFVREMVTDAFSTSRGQLDSSKVLGLLKYRSKVKAQLFQDALNLLEKSIFRPGSKTYYRIAVRDDQGEYQNINLNFSAV